MICKKCGAQIPDGSAFCVSCGASQAPALEEAELPPLEAASAPRETPSGSVPPAPADKRGAALIASILGLVIGTVCLLYGLAAFFGASVSLSSTSFGGDFYTYTYRGIVAIAQSQADQTKLLAMLCVGLGCFMDCHFLQQLRK